MKKLSCMLTWIFLAGAQIAIADEFQKVQCYSDIPKALIGQRSSNERVAVLEEKYRALGLKTSVLTKFPIGCLRSIGRYVVRNSFCWSIAADSSAMCCRFRRIPRRSPAFAGICQVKGRDLPDIIVAILHGAAAADYLPVRAAWKIDQQHAKFVKVSIEGLDCPRSAIYTIDGGP